ncbi:hypothetical protein N7490_009496 [Penicillium lividum]|nr:hypothetical protein N7490_009496 [Penicillium lividum]
MPSLEADELDIIAPIEDSQASINHGKDQVACFLESVENGDDNCCFTVEEEKHVLRRIDLRVLPLLLGAYFFQQFDKSALSYTSIFGLAENVHLVDSQYSWLSSILSILHCGYTAVVASGQQTLRAAMWNGMNGLTFIVGSLFTYGLGHIQSDTLFSYQIIFLFCGLLTVCYSFIVLIFMPDSPMEAKFLSDREKYIAVERLRANQMGIVSREWRSDHVLETLYDFKTWSWFFLVISISIPSGGSFGNLILESIGYTNFESILFNLPFGTIQIIAILGGCWLATRFKTKGLVIVLFATLSAIGTILMLVIPRSNKDVLLFGYYLVSTMAAITPMFYAWEAQNTAGDTKRKCTSAVVLVGIRTGNVIGPQLYSTSQAPAYRPGLITNLAIFVLVAVLAILTDVYLIALNKKHANKREALGKSANNVDESMLRKDKMGKSKVLELEDVRDIRHGNVVDKGFADTTDLRIEDFIYVY